MIIHIYFDTHGSIFKRSTWPFEDQIAQAEI
jgi:hypothetical protein